VVKGIRFEDLCDAGDPAALARRYYDEGADEIVMLDVTATVENRRTRVRTVASAAAEVFVPLAVGGGIVSVADAAAVFEAGADKVCLNSAALAEPPLITSIAERYGSQAVVVSIDARRAAHGFDVYSRSGRARARQDAIAWAREAADRGAGELLVTSIDRDGTRSGFDTELTAAISQAVPIPVIASGGAGRPEHFVEVFTAGRADAALAASIFHFAAHGIAALKQFLNDRGVPVRC
jgi:cyclase